MTRIIHNETNVSPGPAIQPVNQSINAAPLLPALLRLPIRKVALNQPLARMHHLDNVDDLLQRHDRRRNPRDHPRPEAVDLVRSGHLERSRAPWTGKQAGRRRMRGIPGLRGPGLGALGWLQEGGGEGGRGEGEEVEADEEELIQRAADEQYSLYILAFQFHLNQTDNPPCYGSTDTGSSCGSPQPSCDSGSNRPCSKSRTYACNGWPCRWRSSSGR